MNNALLVRALLFLRQQSLSGPAHLQVRLSRFGYEKGLSKDSPLFCSELAGQLWYCSQASSVFSIRLATVMGPTPPGTGVMKLARSAAAA